MERGEMLFLRYSSRWVRQYVRHQLDLNVDGSDHGSFPWVPPRHCISARCPCQFIEEHLKYKPRGKLTFRKFFQLPNFNFK
ncbi:hypothetical protein Phum_PHUM463530 [Pediculus humanus corporis]|uniref:Uncharacterized protein n=1 Tax=Pediculus humanus subsp. corporis TaxID=121224 RepID=E0VVI0_PEDHC|nr:uncharacterized protein Phum_PHUM463530 [Pediculus humanus corporis]EEB17386.1 hypothetical protein Phum_PHUM463530 [Pediculus humanus corporis]